MRMALGCRAALSLRLSKSQVERLEQDFSQMLTTRVLLIEREHEASSKQPGSNAVVDPRALLPMTLCVISAQQYICNAAPMFCGLQR